MSEKKKAHAKSEKRRGNLQNFIEQVAEDVFKNLSDEDRDYLCEHPASIDYHFLLGLGIRNKYIYPSDIDLGGTDPDGLSQSIVTRVISKAIDNYDLSNPFFQGIYNNKAFGGLRRLYHAMSGTYPDSIMEEYAKEEDEAEGIQKCIEKLKGIVLDESRAHALCRKYGVSDEEFSGFREYAAKYNTYEYDTRAFIVETFIGSLGMNGEGFVPYDLAALGSRSLPESEREKLLRLLRLVLEDNYRAVNEMPDFVFNQKDAVLIAVGERGSALKRFKDFNTDDDVIRTALKDNGEALEFVGDEARYNDEYVRLALSDQNSFVLGKSFMKVYRDIDEFVRIAVEANGSNIIYASKRLRDDYDMAKAAILHQRNTSIGYMYHSLSPRLRDDKSLALFDIKEGRPHVEEYSQRLRDDNDIAEAIIKDGHIGWLFEMSPRIRKKYRKYLEG